jgi:hypothetical protein
MQRAAFVEPLIHTFSKPATERLGMDPIEERALSKQSPNLDDMLVLAALMLHYSDDGFDPTAPLASCAEAGDCFESRAFNLAAAVFKAAGMIT